MTWADVLRIETVKPYPYNHMETVAIAQAEQKEGARPKLKGNDINMEAYDTVILGFPNWWGTMPMAVFTLLESYDFFGKTILPLCTHEESKMEQTYVTLNDENKIPQFGLGVYMIPGDTNTKEACMKAFHAGYRHIDVTCIISRMN